MSTTLKHYPTLAQVRAMTDPDDLDRLVSEVADYHRTTTLAQYDGDVNPHMLAAWAQFTNEVISHYDDAEVTRDFKVIRKLTRTELEDVALESKRSDRYYHPENYPLDYAYDDESGKYINATDVKNDK